MKIRLMHSVYEENLYHAFQVGFYYDEDHSQDTWSDAKLIVGGNYEQDIIKLLTPLESFKTYKGKSFLSIPNIHPTIKAKFIRYMVEQHSHRDIEFRIVFNDDSVLNECRLMVAEGLIDKDNLIIFFIDSDDDCFEITCDKKGELSEWPKEFFDLQHNQIIEIITLRQEEGK